MEFVAAGILLSILFIKSAGLFLVWFLFALTFFIIFVKNPGTHIYNIFIPVFILCAFSIHGISTITKKFRYITSTLGIIIAVSVISFFTYQSYLLFVDNSIEYPWEQEKIYKNTTKPYTHQTLTNNIIGFPYNRGWYETRKYIYSLEGFQKYTYITTDNKSSANFYLGLEYGESGKMFAIGIKTPSTFVTDYKFSQLKNKHTIKTIKNSDGQTLARIYEVNFEKYTD